MRAISKVMRWFLRSVDCEITADDREEDCERDPRKRDRPLADFPSRPSGRIPRHRDGPRDDEREEIVAVIAIKDGAIVTVGHVIALSLIHI